jgi:gamma-glutamylcysteine synthetase
MFIRYFGQESFRVGHSFELSGAGGQYLYPFMVPIRIPQKSDIDIRALVRSNNARVTAAFDILLDKDD